MVSLFRNLKVAALLAGSMVVLSGCASGKLVSQGPLNLEDKSSLQITRSWSDISTTVNNRAPKVQLLSIDGFLLNRLYVSQGLGAGDVLVKSADQGPDKQPVAVKAGMTLNDHMDFVSRTLGELELQKVEIANPKPVQISGVKGIRFEAVGKTKKGLNMKVLAQAVTKGEKTYYMIYMAPQEHYYDATLNDAITTMDSLKLPA